MSPYLLAACSALHRFQVSFRRGGGGRGGYGDRGEEAWVTPSKAFGEGESGIDTLLSNRVNSVIIFCRLRPKDESIEKKIRKNANNKTGSQNISTTAAVP